MSRSSLVRLTNSRAAQRLPANAKAILHLQHIPHRIQSPLGQNFLNALKLLIALIRPPRKYSLFPSSQQKFLAEPSPARGVIYGHLRGTKPQNSIPDAQALRLMIVALSKLHGYRQGVRARRRWKVQYLIYVLVIGYEPFLVSKPYNR